MGVNLISGRFKRFFPRQSEWRCRGKDFFCKKWDNSANSIALIKKSLIGMLLSVGITLMAAPMIHNGTGKLKWIFPMPHTNFALHFNGFLAEKNLGIGMSYIYFAVLIAILVSVDVMLMKKIPMGGQ